MQSQQGALLLCLIAATVLPQCFAVVSRNTPISGFATFYGGPQDGVSPTTATGGLLSGACGYEQLSQADWPFWNVVSIGPNNPVAYKGNKKGCGYCIQATCTGNNCGASAKPVTLLVTDACESCAPNQLNLNALTFQNNFNTDLSVGRVNISFEQVDCTPPGNILAKVVKSRPDSGNYIGFALMAIAGEGTVTAVDLKGAGDANYTRMDNLYGDVWETSNFGAAPLSIRITDNYGQTLVAPNVITAIAPGVYDTGVQYSLEPIPSPAPAPSALAPAPVTSGLALGQGFVPTPSGTFCDRQCFAQGLVTSQFKKIGTTLSTFACGVSDPQLGAVAGYQFSNGSATCAVASEAGLKASTDYSCLCQTQAQTQGLQPYNGTSCATACSIKIDKLSGSSVASDAANSSYLCVPISETSLLNRFGHTVKTSGGEGCIINAGVVSTISDQFSCFCLFTAPTTVATARRLL